MPQYVGVPLAPFMTVPGYLGVAHKAFQAGDPSAAEYAPQDLTLAAGLDLARLEDRKALLGQFDRFRRGLDLHGALEGTDAFRSAALSILTGPRVAQAFDISREDPKVRDRYGRHRWGQSCLLARRLAEAGVAVITIDATAPNETTKHQSWDDHANVFHIEHAQRDRLPYMDQALSALVGDLYDRGLDRRVLVIACGEFGRTPKITYFPMNVSGQPGVGRDHWPNAYSAFVAGGGLRMGQVVGATTSKAEYPVQTPLTPRDLLATAYRHLGIDPQSSITDFSGRPVPILFEGQLIAQLI